MGGRRGVATNMMDKKLLQITTKEKHFIKIDEKFKRQNKQYKCPKKAYEQILKTTLLIQNSSSHSKYGPQIPQGFLKLSQGFLRSILSSKS